MGSNRTTRYGNVIDVSSQENLDAFAESRNVPSNQSSIGTLAGTKFLLPISSKDANQRRLEDSKSIPKPGLSERRNIASTDKIGSAYEAGNQHDTHEKTLDKRSDHAILYAWWEIGQFFRHYLPVIFKRDVISTKRRRTGAPDGDDKFQTANKGETTLPNGFSDDISEIDADIDLQTPLPVPSVSRSDSYGHYTPSPGPYGNLGPSNISHTSTTMLVPPCSMGAIMSTSQPPGYLSGPINIMPSQLGSSIGAIRTPLAAMTTLPRPHQAAQQLPPGFLSGGSVIGTQTLRRLSSDHDGNTPRSLSRGATNAHAGSGQSTQQQHHHPSQSSTSVTQQHQQQLQPQSILKNKEPTITELEDTIVMCPPNRTIILLRKQRTTANVITTAAAISAMQEDTEEERQIVSTGIPDLDLVYL
ncbi:AGAP003572-PA-like protein [Anopheles sinensis]|uniref:AGAP003572-PA-like protein n=1 Tax=Anopheles sinensis TaxID=74873 RepID=A0A084VYV0_ANOSI|nr:AGAP003572-PA-like protein [Anopheles sinensis]